MRLRTAPRVSASLFPRVAFAGSSPRNPVPPPARTPGTSISDDLGKSCLELSDPVTKTGTLLLDQQLWFWGQDIVRLGRNLLMEYGFRRERSEEGAARSTCYTLSHATGVRIALWSWGLFFGEATHGGLFVRRSSIQPYLTPSDTFPPLHWTEGTMPRHRCPRTSAEGQLASRLLVRLVRWIARYEDWVVGAAGSEHRKACQQEWRQPVGTPDTVGNLWRGVADDVESESRIVARASV